MVINIIIYICIWKRKRKFKCPRIMKSFKDNMNDKKILPHLIIYLSFKHKIVL